MRLPTDAPVPAILADSTQSWGDVALWSAVLFLLLCAGMVVIIFVRRGVQRTTGESDTPDGFTLQGLRDMHAQGLIDDAEFERARQAIIERVKSRPAADNESASTKLLRELRERRDDA
ncbi:MAG: SHOCT domain-containing protein [Phycisphaeraceae bacterium]|nr:MAG: SHOCT domain-containing protein [Phycisphaeraceae bacterium]